MRRVELAEEGTRSTPNATILEVGAVFWPFPHLPYPGQPTATCNVAVRAIQTAGFVSPVPPAPALSGRVDPGHFQNFTLTDPHHPPGPPYYLPPVGTHSRAGGGADVLSLRLGCVCDGCAH